MEDRELGTTDMTQAKAAGVEVVKGNPGAWVCLCKAKLDGQWMKSTKAVELPGGCLVQTTTLEISLDEDRRPVDTLCWVPNVSMFDLRNAFGTEG